MAAFRQTDEPRVAVLMAVYEPRLDWLKEQLDSLQAQTCPNLYLYLCDDCSPTVPFEAVEALVRERITAFGYSVERNEKNLGSNATFERLTVQAQGDYFAYCDQDDVWLPEKLTALLAARVPGKDALVCSDMSLIDQDGETVVCSVFKGGRRAASRRAETTAEQLLVRNWVTGCTTLLPAAVAKQAVPFCPYMVHDHYLAFWCARGDGILCVEKPLIRHRVHTANQTGKLHGVHDRESYLQRYIRTLQQRADWLSERFADDGGPALPLAELSRWAAAREDNMTGRGGARTVWKYRKFSPNTALFDLAAAHLPDRVFGSLVRLLSKI